MDKRDAGDKSGASTTGGGATGGSATGGVTLALTWADLEKLVQDKVRDSRDADEAAGRSRGGIAEAIKQFAEIQDQRMKQLVEKEGERTKQLLEEQRRANERFAHEQREANKGERAEIKNVLSPRAPELKVEAKKAISDFIKRRSELKGPAPEDEDVPIETKSVPTIWGVTRWQADQQDRVLGSWRASVGDQIQIILGNAVGATGVVFRADGGAAEVQVQVQDQNRRPIDFPQQGDERTGEVITIQVPQRAATGRITVHIKGHAPVSSERDFELLP